jgi:hypothetical protein
MEVMAELLYTVSQVDTSNPTFWPALFFSTGLVVMAIIALSLAIVDSLKKGAIRNRIKQMDWQVDLSSDITEMDVESLEDGRYCLVCTEILIIGALLIPLTIMMMQLAEDPVCANGIVFFGVLCWVVIAMTPLIIRDLRKQHRALDDALADAKAGKEAEAT